MTVSATDFIRRLFDATTAPIYICSFPNERLDETQPPERHVTTRLPSHITSFAAKWDRPKRGLFFCVGTVQPGTKRSKEYIVETIGLHADIDFKNVEGDPKRDEVVRKLEYLRLRPSVVVFSGGGLHAYWLFKEALPTQGNIERIEDDLRLLADLVGGDLQVCEVSRVLRLPQSHNSKADGWVEVQVVEFSDRRYELDDLEDWLAETSPILLRKVRERPITTGESNFWLDYCKEHGHKRPIDVEQRLASMQYMGGEDASIHNTQIACSASLLNAGMDVEDVIDMILHATKAAAGEYGARWNWNRERRNIAKMCATWVKKHPPTERAEPQDATKHLEQLREEQQNKQTANGTGNSAKVIPMPAPKPIPIKKEEQHIKLGEAVIAKMRLDQQSFINMAQGQWFFGEGMWTLMSNTKWLDVRIEEACRGLGFKSKIKLRSETRAWLLCHPAHWRDSIPWDHHHKIPTRSGLLDPVTLELSDVSPDDFCSWRVECEYDPSARCPWWVMMINDFFDDREPLEREALVNVVQEILGAALIDYKSRALSKALVLWGGADLGKSEVLEVLAGLFGSERIGVSLETLENPHGLMPFMRRLPWVLHEAFDGNNKWHMPAIFKSIVTQEPVTINVKNGPLITAAIRSPIFWATNAAPQFKEATKAVVSRMIVIECKRQFIEGELVGTAKEAVSRGFEKPSAFILATELPGLLNWAIAGLQRATRRGVIALTDSIRETSEDIRRDSNLVAGFLEDCVEFNPYRRVSVPDFCAAFSVWWAEQKGEDRKLPSNESIGRAMRAMADPRIAINPKELQDNKRRYYAGVMLNESGLNYWERAVESYMFEGKTAATTTLGGEVNSLIPASWDTKVSVRKMRKLQTDTPQKN